MGGHRIRTVELRSANAWNQGFCGDGCTVVLTGPVFHGCDTHQGLVTEYVAAAIIDDLDAEKLPNERLSKDLRKVDALFPRLH